MTRFGYAIGHGGDFGGPHIFGAILMCIFMLLVFALAVVGVYALIKHFRHRKHAGMELPKIDRSLEILNERYAAGEISDEEYTVKKENLKKG